MDCSDCCYCNKDGKCLLYMKKNEDGFECEGVMTDEAKERKHIENKKW